MKKTVCLLFVLCLALLLTTCKKDKAPVPPEIKIHNVEATAYSVHVDGVYIYEGELKNFYVVYGRQSDLTDGESVKMELNDKKFSAEVEGLKKNTKYYLCVECRTKYTSMRSEVKSFETANATQPEIKTNDITEITQTTAICGGNVTNDGGSEVTARGVCWSKTQNPTIDNDHTTDGTGTGSFTSNLSELTPNTKYYVRAYATNREGTSYGDEKSFTTLGDESVPIVTTNNVTAITTNSATSGGNVTDDGGASVTVKGVCWSTTPNPTIEDEHTEDGSGIGSFVSYMTGLNHNTKYYVRAYATNEKGTAYGEQKEFTTLINEVLPVVTTNNVTNVTQTTATSGGNVTSDGNATVTARGVCWNTSPNPTIDNSHTTDGTGTGTFTSNLTGLTASTTYYVRAYATNEKGTSYGEQKTFTTLPEIELPTITTTEVSNITQTTATSGGNVTDDGGASLTARGVCWSTSQNPTINNSHTTDGNATGSFTSNLTGLTANTTYYVRAYATNAKGTSYGEEKSFTTMAYMPTVVTYPVTDYAETTATFVGNVVSDGGAAVTARGFCWNTSPNPTINNNHNVEGSGNGEFTSNIADLNDNTTYYVRAYATNETGTSYGEEVNFTTIIKETTGSINGHDWVDLGLPSGLKWATCNVGAISPEEYGDYFAWGEIETAPNNDYSIINCSTQGLDHSELQSQGYIDGEGNLTSFHDAATANWGGSWRMPTETEMQELIDECTWTWMTQNGVDGCKVMGPNGNHIFLPAAGYRYWSSSDDVGYQGYYWSSTPFYYGYSNYAISLIFVFYYSSEQVDVYEGNARSEGLTVRPVSE